MPNESTSPMRRERVEVKLSTREYEMLRDVAALRGWSQSQVIREGVRLLANQLRVIPKSATVRTPDG